MAITLHSLLLLLPLRDLLPIDTHDYTLLLTWAGESIVSVTVPFDDVPGYCGIR